METTTPALTEYQQATVDVIAGRTEALAELDAAVADTRADIDALTYDLAGSLGSMAAAAHALGVSSETVRRRAARHEARAAGEPLPPTWRGGRTPTEKRRAKAAASNEELLASLDGEPAA